MNALFAFAIVLSASAVISTPVPKNPSDIDTEVDKYFDEFRKHFPVVKIPRPSFHFPEIKDPFTASDDTDDFADSNPLSTRNSFPGFSSDFFKHFQDSFPSNATNNTVENTREVDGHVIHEKESTFANGDQNNRIFLRSKTVIIRPKDSKDGEEKPVDNHPRPSRFTPASIPSGTSNRENPDADVEMIQNPKKGSFNEAIREGNSIENNDDIVDLSGDTRINDFYRGPIEPKAVFFDVNAKSRNHRRREKPNAQITELSSNGLEEERSAFGSLEHDTDVNHKTEHLQTEEDAEIIDTNTIRKKRKNNYPHHS